MSMLATIVLEEIQVHIIKELDFFFSNMAFFHMLFSFFLRVHLATLVVQGNQ